MDPIVNTKDLFNRNTPCNFNWHYIIITQILSLKTIQWHDINLLNFNLIYVLKW